MTGHTPPRTRQWDEAFFEDEFAATKKANGSHPNRFDDPALGLGVYTSTKLANPLDAKVLAVSQPEKIPTEWQGPGAKSPYDVFVPRRVARTVAEAKVKRSPRPRVNVTLMWGVGGEIQAHGLRAVFDGAETTVIINISGREEGWDDLPDGRKAGRTFPSWGIGISRTGTAASAPEDQVRKILDHAGLDYAEPSIRTLAAYSTGYKGLIGTINNDLLPLGDLARVVFFDCLYRADQPPLPKGMTAPKPLGEELNSGPDELDKDPRTGLPVERSHRGSPFNTRRALNKVLAAQPRTQLVAYSVTMAGSPVYLRPSGGIAVQHVAFVPERGLVELREVPDFVRGVPAERRQAARRVKSALTALICARYLRTGVKDGFFTESEVPRPFVDLFPRLPDRGGIASSEVTARSRGVIPLTSWHRANEDRINEALKAKTLGPALGIIGRHHLILPGDPGRGEEFHRGFVPEFGWEFLL